MSDDNGLDTIVIDNGSGTCKAGFGSDDLPRIEISPILDCNLISGLINSTSQVGGVSPIERGLIVNWENMEKLWNHIFYSQLSVNPEEYPIVLTEVPLNPLENRERMIQIMFEKFNAPAVTLQIPAVLSMYASGRTTGCVLDSGDGTTHAVPVCDGAVQSHAITPLHLAGNDVTNFLMELLTDRGYTLPYTEIIRDIKENNSFVSYDFEEDVRISQETTDFELRYELPDGDIVTISDERFRCPEIFFNPFKFGFESINVPNCIFQSIIKCDSPSDMFQNIILTGGSTLFPGFTHRVQKELDFLYNDSPIIIDTPNNQKYSAWIGGSVLGSSMSEFQDLWISKAEYDESGPSVVNEDVF